MGGESGRVVGSVLRRDEAEVTDWRCGEGKAEVDILTVLWKGDTTESNRCTGGIDGDGGY